MQSSLHILSIHRVFFKAPSLWSRNEMNNVTGLSSTLMSETYLYTHTEWLCDLRQNFQSEDTYGLFLRLIQIGDRKKNLN